MRYYFIIFLCQLVSQINFAQLPAFPGAEGYGKYTTGGRGTPQTPTTVFTVTNLTDVNSPGSLRYALRASAAHRTIVFRVSGTIRLTSRLTIPANTTIAGQTAPGGGICIADHPVVISGDNVILRYLRVRLGDRYQNQGMVDGSGGDDALGNLGNKHIIIDHCSVSWSNDEALTVYRGDSITLQWNIISEPLNYSYHFEAGGSDFQEHGYGGIWGSRHGSFHHNLIMHLKGRAPRFSGNSSYPSGTVENCDFRNNVIYNWRDYSTNGGEGGRYNLVNNYYKYGPSTRDGNPSGAPRRAMIMNPSRSSSLPYPKVYLSGNFVDSYPDVTASNWLGIAPAGGSRSDTASIKVEQPHTVEPMPTESAEEAYVQVLAKAGANLPLRDTLDERLVNDVLNRTGRIIDVQGGYPHGTPFAETIDAWPDLAPGTSPADTDADGMPDEWELLRGLNPNDDSDRSGIAANGYTNLENYLNGLTQDAGGENSDYDLVVATDGSGDFRSVQAAINAVPTNLSEPFVIYIRNGKYKEKISVPSNKPFIQLVGESVANTVLYYDDYASLPLPGGGTLGTQNSASFSISATDFSAFNITFANTYGNGSQAVAVLVNNDRAVFKNCRFLGNQDTLYPKGPGTPRHYFKDCYIDGNVDFIFGSSAALFEDCVIYAKSRSNTGSSYITAPNTPPGRDYGYVFRDCVLPENTGLTTYFLSRPWQNTASHNPRAHNKNVFLNTVMSTSIKPEGWSVWNETTDTDLIYYGEYNSQYWDGSPLDVSQRVPWSYQLTTAEAATYTRENIFGDWDPCAIYPELCDDQSPEIAVTNFRAEQTDTSGLLQWNVSWGISGTSFQLYRATNPAGEYQLIDDLTAVSDTIFNFLLEDQLPPAGQVYYYYLTGSHDELNTHVSDTVLVSSLPAIRSSGQLQPFFQELGLPSPRQQITITAENLLDEVVITPPAFFELSDDDGLSWYTNDDPLRIADTDNTIPETTLSVRLNAPATGFYADTIRLTTVDGPALLLPVMGTTGTLPEVGAETLHFWSMIENAEDDPEQRSIGVTPSVPSFYRLYLSNGTQVPDISAYSEKYGQAFGSTANGDGTWSSSQGGPGGSLKRTFYEEFTVTAQTGYQVRVDSLYLNAAFYNTSSNTQVGVVYSLSNFTSDSTDVTTVPGGFANPIPLANQTGGPTNRYGLALAGLEGVTLEPGQQLSVRLYFSCSSSSAGRYAMLKDIKFTGLATESTVDAREERLPASAIRLYPNPARDRLWLEHPQAGRNSSITIFNAQGQLITHTICAPQTRRTEILLTDLPGGWYYAAFRNDRGVATRAFSKQ
ncbi:pectinesterase family protein [Flavilitoribacter nigricans]|uniref:T9SS type A sorting domain-containing protein n=1 Tax=Flavilitoribacter nigricans (strain ATCC 23147 / DSM 23189 / NBRC 102662 / NCIMB 1420 / SS-2) TaxID=1122177 RepID=A0A2D0MZF1_FLAN2|nr:pectinesterase family protein [Flavilitoribacter nigricans]PHN01651.1 hypothetical protein CRP01_36140 [Flavilitoribacter nigricans DSM 23189 = NBRC 102662]